MKEYFCDYIGDRILPQSLVCMSQKERLQLIRDNCAALRQNQSQRAKIDLETHMMKLMLYDQLSCNVQRLFKTDQIPMDKDSFAYVQPCSSSDLFIAVVAKSGKFGRYLRLFKFDCDDDLCSFTKHFNTECVVLRTTSVPVHPTNYEPDKQLYVNSGFHSNYESDKQLYVNSDFHSTSKPLKATVESVHYAVTSVTRRHKHSRISFKAKSPINYHHVYANDSV